jgi:predicted CXXCH cytochrome family protein
LVVLCCVFLLTASAIAARAADNPHWQKDACETCHTKSDGKLLAIPATEVSNLCLRCHDGVNSVSEVHPIGRPIAQQNYIDPGWPTTAGNLDCITCHDAKQACDTTGETPEVNAAFLRSDHSVESPTSFCANCHKPERDKKLNPHLMLAPDRSVLQDRCQVCHANKMDPSTLQRSGKTTLKEDQLVLCRSCHPHHKDISRQGHVGTTIKPEMLAYMRARELSGLLTIPDKSTVNDLQAAGAKPTLMVPAPDGKVVCSTCHNPHERGVFPPDSVLAYHALKVVDGHTRTPVRGEQFCNHCHNGF